jgi:ABC-type uncharacterized transport system involved in gliding motility auxiliary subunit
MQVERLIVLSEPLPMTDIADSHDPLAEYLQQEWGILLGKDMVVDLISNQPFIAYAYQYGEHLITDKLERVITFFPTARSVSLVEEPPRCCGRRAGLHLSSILG